MKKEKEMKFEDYDEETQKQLKELVIARIKSMPDNFRISIG